MLQYLSLLITKEKLIVIISTAASPERFYEPMVTDEQNSERIIPGCSSSSYQNKSVCNRDNLGRYIIITIVQIIYCILVLCF